MALFPSDFGRHHSVAGAMVNGAARKLLIGPNPAGKTPPSAFQGGDDGEGGVSRSWRDGLPDGRASQEQGRPRRHRLQPQRRQGRQMGRAVRRQEGRDAEGGRRGPGLRDDVRRQRQRRARGGARRQRRIRRHEQGRGVRRSHHGVGRDRAQALRRGEEARLRFRRRAGVGRPGRRRERRAHGDVRRRCRARTPAPRR